jgi:branched-chain amino acid transport system ATP-binding protein
VHFLELRDIRVYYGKAVGLAGLSLHVKAGEMVGVVGPNGAGKSTLLRAISGMVPVQGEILLEKEPIQGKRPHEIIARGIIHCPERRQLFAEFTVEENLQMGAFLRRDRQGIRMDMDRVYGLFPVLAERKGQVSGTLSGGEQQMLAIGRSLMGKPRLLMMDEPSIGLSPLVKGHLAERIVEIWRSGIMVMLVEQDASLALDLTQRVYILEHGKVGLEGPSQELLHDEQVRRVYFQLG